MLFRCEDLERYVTETSQEKMNLILINKADFLSERQRKHWAEYFDRLNLPVAFFSALEENQNNQLRKMKLQEEEEGEEEEDLGVEPSDDDDDEDDSEYEESNLRDKLDDRSERNASKSQTSEVTVEQEQTKLSENETIEKDRENSTQQADCQLQNSTRLLTRGELIELFKTIHKGRRVQEGRAVVGLVGYPNVGKSSTINSLLTYKKVSVSATPGKTKHFQVLSVRLFFTNFNDINIF